MMERNQPADAVSLLRDDEDDGPVPTRHYFYAATRPMADALAAALTRRGFDVAVDASPRPDHWLVLATHMATPEETLNRSWGRMAELAERLGVTYDGHEMEFRRLLH